MWRAARYDAAMGTAPAFERLPWRRIAAFMIDQGHELEGEVEPFPFFRLEITEVGRVSLGGDPPDHLDIEIWRPGEPVRRLRR